MNPIFYEWMVLPFAYYCLFNYSEARTIEGFCSEKRNRRLILTLSSVALLLAGLFIDTAWFLLTFASLILFVVICDKEPWRIRAITVGKKPKNEPKNNKKTDIRCTVSIKESSKYWEESIFRLAFILFVLISFFLKCGDFNLAYGLSFKLLLVIGMAVVVFRFFHKLHSVWFRLQLTVNDIDGLEPKIQNTIRLRGFIKRYEFTCEIYLDIPEEHEVATYEYHFLEIELLGRLTLLGKVILFTDEPSEGCSIELTDLRTGNSLSGHAKCLRWR